MKRANMKKIGIMIVAGLIFAGMMLINVTSQAFTETGGGDHGGQDWIMTADTEIAGVHTNIGTFRINPGVTVTVKAYDGTNFGSVEINAADIDVRGTLTASGSGYGGGGGGGGGGGDDGGGEHPGRGGGAGRGAAGGGNGIGGSGGASNNRGGAGGKGGGAYGGAGGAIGNNGGFGFIGGYLGTGVNEDTSTDGSLVMGSGGGGGAGGKGGIVSSGNYEGGGGGGGGAGNPGGGYIKLYAANNLIISSDGSVLAKGKAASAGNGGNGGSATTSYAGNGGGGGHADVSGTSSYGNRGSGNPNGYRGGGGAAGAGGGILLKASTVAISGNVNSLGGGDSETNGGTVKIFYAAAAPDASRVAAGRIFTQSYCTPDCSCAGDTCAGETCTDPICNSSCQGTLQPDCGSRQCGAAPNGCGTADECGTCTAPLTCFGGVCAPPVKTFQSQIKNTGGSPDYGAAAWTAVEPAGTSAKVKIRTGNSATMAGAPGWPTCAYITNGEDISSNNCVTDGEAYVQYWLELSAAESAATPVFKEMNIDYTICP